MEGIRVRSLVPAVALVFGAILWPNPAFAAELEAKTVKAYDRYIALLEKRIDEDLGDSGSFLWPDRQPAATRQGIYSKLKQGQVVVEQMETPDGHTEVDVPDGMIHDWRGLIFIPGVTLDQTLAVIQNYGRDDEYYAPTIVESKVLEHNDHFYRVFYRMNKKAVVNVVFDATFDIHYQQLGPDRAVSRSRAVLIRQIRNPGKPDESTLPPGHDSGFLWRLHSYWRFQEKDGGTYVELESVALSRPIPWLLRWMIAPIVRGIARNTISNLLTATRATVLKYVGSPAQKETKVLSRKSTGPPRMLPPRAACRPAPAAC